jgi:peptide deformylase
MSRLPIYVVPHAVLKKVSEPVTDITDDLRKLIENMFDTMYAAEGIGLAAPQVGVLQRVLVMDVDQTEDNKSVSPICMINPEIILSSDDMNVHQEGCLSIPAQYGDVERPKQVKVKYINRDGNPQEMETDNLLATCVQHEIDHLNGVLFTDHLSSLKRDMVMRKLKKFTKENAEDLKEHYVIS